MADIFSRLDELERAHAELTRDLADPAVLGDAARRYDSAACSSCVTGAPVTSAGPSGGSPT
jgi:hypothetical protein